jgi:hypothetical protein
VKIVPSSAQRTRLHRAMRDERAVVRALRAIDVILDDPGAVAGSLVAQT